MDTRTAERESESLCCFWLRKDTQLLVKLSARANKLLNQALAREARAYEVPDTPDNLVSSVAAERNNE